MKNKFIALTFFTLSLAILIASCSKEEKTTLLNDTQETEVFVYNLDEEEIVNDIFNEVMLDLDQFNVFKSNTNNDCPVKTVETPADSAFPKVVTRNYGDSCATKWGKVRSGKIIISYESAPKEVGSIRKVTFENYMVDSVLISGHKIIEFIGTTNDEFPQYKINGNINIVRPNGVEVKRNIHKIRTKIAGYDTKEKSDDEWLIEGDVKVSKSNGAHYKVTITNPLYRLKSCKWIVSGTKEIKVFQSANDLEESANDIGYIIIDYGNGECDRIATKQINDDEPVEFKIGRH